MKRLVILLVIVTAVPFVTAGCFTRDLNHAHEHWMTFQDDLEEIHREIDLIFFERVDAEPFE